MLNEQRKPKYFRIALQSGLAAALCLGLPAGLLFWLILANEASHSPIAERIIVILQDHGLYSIYIVVIGSLLWSYLLGRISRYRRWWWIQLASALGILLAWFSPLSNFDGLLPELWPAVPVYINYAISMCGLIGGVTFFVALAYGLILRSWKAALTMALSTRT